MDAVYQISFDDIEYQKQLESEPERTAFIDECGSFGFDFTTSGTSKYYILCAIVVKNSNISALRKSVETIKKNNGFGNTEMKSSKIGNENKRRTRIISQLSPIDNFRLVVFVADKQRFMEDSQLAVHKKTFIKFLNQHLYNLLYKVYPKLKIIEDEVGDSEFQSSFKKYIEEQRPQYSLLDNYDFDYCNSKDELLVQLADIIGGTINKYFTDPGAPNYLEMLKGKISVLEKFPNEKEPYWGTSSPEKCKYNKDIYTLSIKCAKDYISKYAQDETEEKRSQIAFLRYLLFHVQYVNSTQYVSSNKLLAVINEHTKTRISRDFLYRRIIAPLRDHGVIIASCKHGYKIPISINDITAYLNSTHTIVSPMLHRVEISRNLIMQKTENSLDILDDPAFLKYKKYFD